MNSNTQFVKYVLLFNEAISLVNAQSGGPSMRMYFHGGINDYLMFESWVPKSVSSFVAGWILFFLLAVMLEGILVYCHNVESRWLLQETDPVGSAFSLQSPEAPTFNKVNSILTPSTIITWYRATMLSVFRVIESTLAYFLMLVTMIYNTGLFFSVITGHAVGVFLFARFRTSSVRLEEVNSNLGTDASTESALPVLDDIAQTGYKVSGETTSSCH